MQTTSANQTLSIECSDWAENFAKEALANGQVPQFYAFKPDRKKNSGAEYLGKFTDGSGNIFQPKPMWLWHVAVEMNGLLHDEIHPNGVIIEKYLAYFPYINYISVTQHKDLESAIQEARSGS